MKEVKQAAEFYESLSESERKELAEAVAADIYFFHEELQDKAEQLLRSVSQELWTKIEERNSFTL